MLRFMTQPKDGSARPSLVLAIVCAGVVLASLDMFIVNLALPAIAVDLGGDLAALSWVLNGYAIIYAATLIPAGRLADRTGRKRGFLIGVLLFTVTSALCAVAANTAMLVGFRVLQAIGAALLTPTSLSIVLATFPPERRGRAVRIWTAMGGLAAALGPMLGGVLTEFDWRWIFLVNVPVGVAACIVGARVIPDLPGERGRRPDTLGSALLTVAIGVLVLALVEGNEWGWGSARIAGLFVLAVLAGTGFVVRSAAHASPVLELSLLKVRTYALVLLSMLLFSAAFAGMLLAVVLWAQDQWGWSALRTGLALAPAPLMVPLFAMVAGPLIARFGPGPVIALGNFMFAAGVLWWAVRIGLAPDYGDLIIGLLVTGVAVGLTLPTLMATASVSLPPHRFATGAAVVSMARQVGFAVGVAVMVAVIGAPAPGEDALTAFRHGWFAVIIAVALAAVPALMLRRTDPAPRAAPTAPSPTPS
jgi:EmrB/QacA subfamily drug resistance transporter